MEENLEKKLLNNLQTFLESIRKVEDYYEILPEIFRLHVELSDNNQMIQKIEQHVQEVFHVSIGALYDYFNFNKIFTTNDFEYNQATIKNALKVVNKLKIKYGLIIREKLAVMQNPFLITNVQTNVQSNSTQHTLNMIRGDKEAFTGQFTADSLLAIINNFTETLQKCLTQSIYTLNEDNVNIYIEKNTEMLEILRKIADEKKGE